MRASHSNVVTAQNAFILLPTPLVKLDNYSLILHHDSNWHNLLLLIQNRNMFINNWFIIKPGLQITQGRRLKLNSAGTLYNPDYNSRLLESS